MNRMKKNQHARHMSHVAHMVRRFAPESPMNSAASSLHRSGAPRAQLRLQPRRGDRRCVAAQPGPARCKTEMPLPTLPQIQMG